MPVPDNPTSIGAQAMSDIIHLPVNKIRFRDDLYPRINTNPTTVQQYSDDLSVLPPIEVNQHYELIDGWHRWTAHRKIQADTIEVIVNETRSDAHFLELAIIRNASHGMQLSREDKRKMAHRIYWAEPSSDIEKRLPTILSVSRSTVAEWLARSKKDAKAEQREKAFDLWLSCHTRPQIAKAVKTTEAEIRRLDENFPVLEKSQILKQNAAQWSDGFKIPLYNVWKQQARSSGSSHPGNTESSFVENLLYLYTNPFDIICDPFAGGGSTIDVCKKRLRRYLVSDLTPIVEREHEIHQHDVTTGALKPPRWQDVSLVYLDPPYWKQMEGQYSNNPNDFANMEIDAFHGSLTTVVKEYAAKIPNGAKIALIIQPTQWRAKGRKFTDHMAAIISKINLPIVQRFQCPYESQQCTPQMVEWAKSQKECLVLSREMIIWEKC